MSTLRGGHSHRAIGCIPAGIEENVVDQPYPTAEATFKAFGEVVSPGKVEFFRRLGVDLVMGERNGARFQDAYTGRWYFNCHSNGGVFNLGHRNPVVAEAVRSGLEELDVGNHHLVSGWRSALGDRLLAGLDHDLTKVVFTASGSEAVDAIVKAARGVTGRANVVSIEGAWHGNTGFAYSASDAAYRAPFGPDVPGFTQVPFDDLPAMEQAVDDDTALVLIEPIPATLAMPVASDGYFQGVADLCRRAGAMLAFDEVQTGLGRTGRMWGHEHFEVVPDAVITGKGLSGGFYPMGAVMISEHLFEPFTVDPFGHTSTFGGAEIGTRAALAVLDTIETPGFLERVSEIAEQFRRGFDGMPFEMRGIGLMAALKFAAEGSGLMATKMLVDAGVFVVYANNESSAVQFLPPLTIADTDVNAVIDIVRQVFG
jgi:acetylornithine/succinyldiaminopimelate/putrescine aminotransferase